MSSGWFTLAASPTPPLTCTTTGTNLGNDCRPPVNECNRLASPVNDVSLAAKDSAPKTFAVSAGLLEPKHRAAIAKAICVYLWFMNRVTDDRPKPNANCYDGVVLGGQPVNIRRISAELGIPMTRSVSTSSNFPPVGTSSKTTSRKRHRHTS